MKNNKYLPTIIVAVVVAIVAFLAGVAYQKRQNSQLATNQNTPAAGQRPSGSQPGGTSTSGVKQGTGASQRTVGSQGNGRVGVDNQPIVGKISNLAGQTLTITTADGGSKIVILSEETQYTTTTTAKLSDLTSGSQITVTGASNSDGSVAAKAIMLGELSFTEPPAGDRPEMAGENVSVTPSSK